MKTRRYLFEVLIVAQVTASQAAAPLEGRVFQRAHTDKGFAICGSCQVPQNISAGVTLNPVGEPGQQIVVSGTIYKSDGVTPASGITVFLYQADAGGYYHRPKEDVFSPRLYGWLRTGKDGHYEIRTIRPEPEVLAPDEPAHIHAHVFASGIPEHFLHEFWFAGDPRIKPKELARLNGLGRFSPIVHLAKGKHGILNGTCDIKLNPISAYHYESQ
jgi:protocatechuate 3,4-dioxygenase beta subunit